MVVVASEVRLTGFLGFYPSWGSKILPGRFPPLTPQRLYSRKAKNPWTQGTPHLLGVGNYESVQVDANAGTARGKISASLTVREMLHGARLNRSPFDA